MIAQSYNNRNALIDWSHKAQTMVIITTMRLKAVSCLICKLKETTLACWASSLRCIQKLHLRSRSSTYSSFLATNSRVDAIWALFPCLCDRICISCENLLLWARNPLTQSLFVKGFLRNFKIEWINPEAVVSSIDFFSNFSNYNTA